MTWVESWGHSFQSPLLHPFDDSKKLLPSSSSKNRRCGTSVAKGGGTTARVSLQASFLLLLLLPLPSLFLGWRTPP